MKGKSFIQHSGFLNNFGHFFGSNYNTLNSSLIYKAENMPEVAGRLV